jgi:hypothetical protein
MSARSLILAAALIAGIATPALARGDVFTVKLEAPVSQQTRIITQNTIWTCVEDTCRARPSHASTVRACRQFVRELGARVSAYGPEGDELTAEEIARCNGDAPALQQARN